MAFFKEHFEKVNVEKKSDDKKKYAAFKDQFNFILNPCLAEPGFYPFLKTM